MIIDGQVPNTLPLPSAALLGHCLPTALALSQYFHNLNEGDVVVQNCAGDAIGAYMVPGLVTSCHCDGLLAAILLCVSNHISQA